MSDANIPNRAAEVQTVELTGGDRTVTATKLVSMGELLLLECGTDQLRLDAMLLEGISWQQDGSELAAFVGTPEAVLEDAASSYDNPLPETTDRFTVSNEYTTVELGVVDTGAGEGLLFKSEKGASILGPSTLGALTTIDSTRELSKWFQTPIGPEADL